MTIDKAAKTSRKSWALYITGALLWTFIAAFCPTWIGTYYSKHDGKWHAGGGFGLDRSFYLLWESPTCYGGVMPAVRWPFQSPTQREHVEIVLEVFVVQSAVGIAVWGAMLSTVLRKQAGFVTVAISVAAAMILVCVSLFVLTVLSFLGFRTSPQTWDFLVALIFLGGLAAGWVTGLRIHNARTARQSAANGGNQPMKS